MKLNDLNKLANNIGSNNNPIKFLNNLINEIDN